MSPSTKCCLVLGVCSVLFSVPVANAAIYGTPVPIGITDTDDGTLLGTLNYTRTADGSWDRIVLNITSLPYNSALSEPASLNSLTGTWTASGTNYIGLYGGTGTDWVSNTTLNNRTDGQSWINFDSAASASYFTRSGGSGTSWNSFSSIGGGAWYPLHPGDNVGAGTVPPIPGDNLWQVPGTTPDYHVDDTPVATIYVTPGSDIAFNGRFGLDLNGGSTPGTSFGTKPASLYWSGTGTWGQGTTANWSTVSGGSRIQPWISGDAVFEGSPGTVTVAGGVGWANSRTFTADSYTLGGTGAITLTGTGGKITTGAGTDTINCPLAGSVGLTKNGTGTLVLTGANTYTGGMTIQAGTLQVGGGGTTGSISGNVSNSGVLAFNRSDPVTFVGNISGNGGLTQMGPGRLTVGNSQMLYTGTTNVSGGALRITNASSSMAVLTTTKTNVSGGFLVLDYSANTGNETSLVTQLVTDLHNAYNGGSNSFQSGHGYQIYSTSASTTQGLGWVDNTTTHQVTVMPALYGDCNLDGKVNFSDLSVLLAHYGSTSGMGWSQGDFTYDGTVNFNDLSKLLATYGSTGPLNINNLPALALQSIEADSQAMQMLASDGITIMARAPFRSRQAWSCWPRS